MTDDESRIMNIPIGISDFRTLIEYRNAAGIPYLFIDKSMFVKEILDGEYVTLITRPRRFGKTLNLSLLRYFFAKTVKDKPTKHLFEHLEIAKHMHYMEYQGKYPVIFLSFKNMKGETFEQTYADFKELIRAIYDEHKQVIYASKTLTESDAADYQAILMREASDALINISLQNLTRYLTKAYGEKTIILIDEYDAPIQTAYVKHYYKEMVDFIRSFLGAALKDNLDLEKAVLTGILRISKESIFSDLNNVSVHSILHRKYGEFFGFTETEVGALLEKTHLSHTAKKVAAWYNGYQVDDWVIYNPWSIMNYINSNGEFRPYWVNTSDNILLKMLFVQSGIGFKIQFEDLLQKKTVEKLIEEDFVFGYLDSNENALWNLFLMAGYLKITAIQNTEEGPVCQLAIPNQEVWGLLKKFIAQWLSGTNDSLMFKSFLTELLRGNIERFEERLQNILLVTCSVYDVKGKNPEKFYHGLLLGLLSGIDQKYYVIDSNKEAGMGRYDIIIAPKMPNQLGIIMELKSIEQDDHAILKEAATEALNQIETRQYHQTSFLTQAAHCLKIGIAFSGKELSIASSLR